MKSTSQHSSINQTADRLIGLIQKLGGPELIKVVRHKLGAAQSPATAAVSFAGLFSESDKQRLQERLKQRFAELEKIEYHEDPSLIAGLKIQYRDYRFEDSVQQRLQTLKHIYSNTNA